MRLNSLDFETASEVDLVTRGAMNYAKDPSTHALCCGYRYDNGPLRIWLPDDVQEIVQWQGHPPPETEMQPEDKFTAFNAAFDRRIYARVAAQENWAPAPIERWSCTLIQAQLNGLPGALDKAGRALRLPRLKDPLGKFLIDKLSKPICDKDRVLIGKMADKPSLQDNDLISFAKGYGLTENRLKYFNELSELGDCDFIFDLLEYLINAVDAQERFNRHPLLFKAMIKYCLRDVHVESEILSHLHPLPPHQLDEYHAFERMNELGIPVDVESITKIAEFCEIEKKIVDEDLVRITRGKVKTTTSHAQAKAWLTTGYALTENGYVRMPGGRIRISPECLDLAKISIDNRDGTTTHKLCTDKFVKAAMLEMYDKDRSVMSKTAAAFVEASLGNKTSLAKFKSRLNKQRDGRVHDAYSLGGAQSTLRTASKGGDNWQNMYRDCVKDHDAELSKVLSGELEPRQALTTCAKMIRTTVKANPGKILLWADYSSVESRCTAVLCGDKGSREKLKAFIAQDLDPTLPDMYELQAELMGLIQSDYPNHDLRQLGKGGELGCNFGGGGGAIYNTTRGKIPREIGDVLAEKWNEANPWNRPFCLDIKHAAWSAMRDPGEHYHAGKLIYIYYPDSHNGLGALTCVLPDGTSLYYVDARLERIPSKWDPDKKILELTALKANRTPKEGEKEWPRIALWYGTLIENATQAYSATITKQAIVTLDKMLPLRGSLFLQTHDELGMEVPRDQLHMYAGALVHAMVNGPAAERDDFPIAADAEFGLRYSKHSEGIIKMRDALEYYEYYQGRGDYREAE